MPTIDQNGDTPRAYAALCDYCALGPTRSLEKLVQIWTSSGLEKPPTKWLSTLKRWSTEHDWQKRVADYDRSIQEAEEAARATIRAARRAELEDRDWIEGTALREAVGAILSELPKFIRRSISKVERTDPLTEKTTITEVITLALGAGPGELARALKLASELQRLSVGEPTERHEHSGPGGGPIRTEVYEYSAAIAGIARRSGEDSDPPGENAGTGDGSEVGEVDDGRGD